MRGQRCILFFVFLVLVTDWLIINYCLCLYVCFVVKWVRWVGCVDCRVWGIIPTCPNRILPLPSSTNQKKSRHWPLERTQLVLCKTLSNATIWLTSTYQNEKLTLLLSTSTKSKLLPSHLPRWTISFHFLISFS